MRQTKLTQRMPIRDLLDRSTTTDWTQWAADDMPLLALSRGASQEPGRGKCQKARRSVNRCPTDDDIQEGYRPWTLPVSKLRSFCSFYFSSQEKAGVPSIPFARAELLFSVEAPIPGVDSH